MAKKVTILVSLLCAISFPAATAEDYEYLPMQAEYRIWGTTVLDPPPDEKKDQVAIVISGEAAKSIFASMPGIAYDPCHDGASRKDAGGLSCYKAAEGDYTCSVAIALDTGVTSAAQVC